jgi:hypothetical protein
MSAFISTITSQEEATRHRSLASLADGCSAEELLAACADLDHFRKQTPNLYERVRALFFLYGLHRFHLPERLAATPGAMIPYGGYTHLLKRRFEEAIHDFTLMQSSVGPSDAVCSALAGSYHALGFQTLANQVRRSVRSARGNQWMFRVGHHMDQPLRLRPELKRRSLASGLYPILAERTPVRMDLSHSAWSDIFFLGMDFPEGARVLNVSIDLAVRGRDASPRPPIETFLRVIDEPVLRLISVDLECGADVRDVAELFDFGRDYLGLLKAGVIASGLVPPGMEGSGESLDDVLGHVTGEPGKGLELVTKVNGIPRGSRLAVSTNLLASMICLCMRATGQVQALTGSPSEEERRVVAARAILGEWLGGSGGGWQDSGGVWPGMKLISGALAEAGDPEFGISRGRLLPNHRLLADEDASRKTQRKLQDSLVLVHGGMAQDVGPILEMVTEKYLLRCEPEWAARREAMAVLDRIVESLRGGDIPGIGAQTTHNFAEPIQTIIPWAGNLYTERLIGATRERFQKDFWGFWMLGGMSGGGMGFIVDPSRKAEAQEAIGQTMSQEKRRLEHALPFAMEPVVYDFAINDTGTAASLHADDEAVMPEAYYLQAVPAWLRTSPRYLSETTRRELDAYARHARLDGERAGRLLDRLLPAPLDRNRSASDLDDLLGELGFDHDQHEQIRSELRTGRIGLSQNRLPETTIIEDVHEGDFTDARVGLDERPRQRGEELLRQGAVGVITLAAGVGSRWTKGAGVVKALHPFCRLGGRHRRFLEVHLRKTAMVAGRYGSALPHVVTTSHLTHAPIEQHLAEVEGYGLQGDAMLSPGRSIGLRFVPMVRDLQFLWGEMAQQELDEQQEKLRESTRSALMDWARGMGEAADYRDNLPAQCLHPVGHWYEVPNLLLNGTLHRLLGERPQLRHLMLHNIDTVGADLDPALLGVHAESGDCLTFEVISRRLEDRGGGLARVGGRPRLLEGLAMPRDEDEFDLSFYNTATTWIDIDQLLATFGLDRAGLADEGRVASAIRAVAARMPTYIAMKEVKKRWGHGQEDVYPVAQFEKLWTDMTALPDVDCGFLVVPRHRGQQLKEQEQLDGWVRDGSAAYVERLCGWA